MNIGEFSSLDRETQFAEAGKIAGVSPSVFDGMWRTESARGANMLSPAGAEGHFGLMPKTRATWEGRFGTSIDPHNFGQSLYAAAYTLKENLGRFKNLPDALRAYNGGWDPSTWGNKETAAYAGKVLGTDDEDADPEVNASTAEASAHVGLSMTAAADLWDKPFARAGRNPPMAKSATSKAADKLAEIGGAPSLSTEQTFAVFGGATADAATAQLKREKEKDDTSFMDAAKGAAYNTLPVALMQAMNRDPEPVDPSFQVTEEDLKGYDLGEQRDLANATSRKQFERIKFDIEYGKEQDDITFRNGTVFGLGASFLAAAPEAMLTGGLASLAFKGSAYGSIALAKAGNKAGAILSSAAEGAVGNTVNVAALDMLGRRQGVTAYALGAAGGLLNPILAGGFIGRTAERVEATELAERLLRTAAEKEAKLIETAKARLPAGHTPEELAAEVTKVEAEGIRADIQSHKAAIPENRRMDVGDDLSEDIKLAEAADALPDAANEPAAKVAAFNEPKDIVSKLLDEYGPTVRTPYEDPHFQAKQNAAAKAGQYDPTLTRLTGMPFEQIDQLPKGVNVTPNLEARMATDLNARNAVDTIRSLFDEYMPPGSRLVMNDVKSVGPTNAGPNAATGGALSLGDTHVIAINFDEFKGNRTLANHVAIHELGHTIFHANAPLVPRDLIARMDAEWGRAAKMIQEGNVAARAERLAVTNPGRFDTAPIKSNAYAFSRTEHAAEQFVSHLQNRLLSGDFGKLNKTVINQVLDGVKAVFNYVMDVVNRGLVKPGKEFDEFFTGILKGTYMKKAQVDEFLAPELKLPTLDEVAASADAVPPALAKEVSDFLNDPEVLRSGLDRLPLGTTAERAEAKQILALYKKARDPQYAVDEKRLSTLLNKVDALNPTSNLMLRSKNPVVRMAAIELLENGGGAAGRRSTASIAKYMNERAIVGTAIVDMERSFKSWFKGQPDASNMKEAFTGRKRAEFNRLVAEEIEQRRNPGQQTDFGASVREAADTMEASFERARLMQIDAKTPGWAALPETSRGYLPHRIKSNVYRTLTLEQKRALHRELTDQFITVSEYDPTFADQLASRYLDRVEQRALGGYDAPMGMHQTGAADVIKEALEQMNLSRPEIDAMMKRHIKGAANHTKKRLNIDLSKQITAEDGTTFRLLDLYDTDMLSLMRGQSQRVSGEVALARHGVMGKPGLAILRRAMGYGADGEAAVAKEVGAFDQVSAEFLGSPFGEANKWVDRATQFNSLASLGGMGFNQLGESINIATTLGVKAALSHVAEFSRLRTEILKAGKGMKVDNELLSSLETMGGAEFGTDAYKMVFPMDNPDLFANSMGPDSINAADRLLRGGSHLQSKLSLWKTIHSTQVRSVAEQIVLKAAKALKEGKGDFHLRDMGIDDDMLERLRADFRHIVTMRDGKVTGFDITKATDKEAAHAFIQGVHRGASQIIQGTFIGETGKYVHNSWLRMLTQFRSFSLTGIDKQWNRQVGNRGITGAVMITLGAMGAAAPLYMLRTYLASIGRKDQDQYLEQHLSFGSIARATTNYIATSGLGGDFLDAATAITGTGAMTGGRSGATSTLVGNLLAPTAGKVDKLWGAAQNTKDGTDPHALIKELPLSRLPFLIPAINALGH